MARRKLRYKPVQNAQNVRVSGQSASFKIIPASGSTADDTYTVTAPTADDFGTVTVTPGTKDATGQVFNISFTPKDNEELQRLATGETKDVSYTLTISYRRDGALDTDPLVQSTETFTVRFTGTNDAPELDWDFDDADHQVHENDDGDAGTEEGKTTGHWRFVDIDNGDTAGTLRVGHGKRQSVKCQSDHWRRCLLNLFKVEGTYGALTVRGDGTWEYVRDMNKIQAAPAGEAMDVFYVDISDAAGSTSDEVTVTINIFGENDNPVLGVTGTGDANADSDDNTVHVVATESTTSTQGAAQTASGTWAASDLDDNSVVRLIVDSSDIGTFTLSGVGANRDLNDDSTSHTAQGTYGIITFNSDGTWTYVLTARAERIAHDETPTEVFTVQLRDEFTGLSTQKTITITITGTNDAPTDLTGDTTGTVRESGYRTDAEDNASVDKDNTSFDAPDTGNSDTTTETIDDTAMTCMWLMTNPAAAIRRNTPSPARWIPPISTALAMTAKTARLTSTLRLSASRNRENAGPTAPTNIEQRHSRTEPGNAKIKNTSGSTDFEYSQKGTYGTLTVNIYRRVEYVLDNTDPQTIALGHGDSEMTRSVFS